MNSSLFALPRPVASLERAVMVLGLKPLRSLVLGLSLPAIQTRQKNEGVWKYWQESVAGAVIARELSVRLKRREPDDDLVAALLRDLGILVLQEVFPAEYRGLGSQHPELGNRDRCEQEKLLFGVDHAEISAGVLDSWRLPAEIVHPVRYHHVPEKFLDGPSALKERACVVAFCGSGGPHPPAKQEGDCRSFAPGPYAFRDGSGGG